MSNIRDVAKEAGVSISTVSRILSGDTSFQTTDATRNNVLKAVSKLNYVYSSRQKKKIQLGCILAVTAEKYSDPFFTEILAAMEKECDRCGAAITFTRNYNELCNPMVLNELLDANLSGIFLMERLPEDLLEKIKMRIDNIVFIDNGEADYYFDEIGYDHVSANRQVMSCLISHGYRRIAIIGGSSPNEPFMDSIRLICYRDALRTSGITYDPNLVKDCAWDLNLCATQTRELMNMDNPPDAIFAGSDSLASAILGELFNMGKNCPEDVGVIGFNNIELSAHMVPALTTVDVPTHEIGMTAVQRIMEKINGNGGATRKILFPTKIISRDSLRKEV